VDTSHPCFRLQMRQPSLLRPLESSELSVEQRLIAS